MRLIDELRQAADKIPPSDRPTLNELAGVLGALIANIEHGDSLFTAAREGAESVAKLIAPAAEDVADEAIAAGVQALDTPTSSSPPPASAPAPASPVVADAGDPSPPSEVPADAGAESSPSAPADTAADTATLIADLQAQLQAQQTLIAQLQRGTVASVPATGGDAGQSVAG